MEFEHRQDLSDEIARYYTLPTGMVCIEHPVAIYSTPGLDYEGVMDQHGELHLLPRPGECDIRVVRDPMSGEPLHESPF